MNGNWLQLEKILWKQYLLKHRSALLIFLILAILIRALGVSGQEDSVKGMKVGICALDEDGETLFGSLVEESGIFHFCLYEDEETMIRDVKNGNLECGYVLPEDFFEHLLQGKIRRQIPLYYSVSSGAHKLSYEVVFAHLFGMLSDEVLKEWFLQSDFNTGELAQKQLDRLLELKEYCEQGGETFAFHFEKVGVEAKEKTVGLDVVRGVGAVMMFFLSLLGLANSKELWWQNKMLSHKQAKNIGNRSLHVAIAGSVMAGGIFILIVRGFDNLLKEVGALLCYYVLLEVTVRLLGIVLRTAQNVYSVAPVLLLVSLLLCPVFFRIDTWVPILGYIGKAFPVSWYLNFFY